jgi:Sulfotransferase family
MAVLVMFFAVKNLTNHQLTDNQYTGGDKTSFSNLTALSNSTSNANSSAANSTERTDITPWSSSSGIDINSTNNHDDRMNNSVDSSSSCPTMMRAIGLRNEHKPIIFSKPGPWTSIPGMATTVATETSKSSSSKYTDVMVCRVPKVGSTQLRQIHFAFYNPNYMAATNTSWETGGPPSNSIKQHLLGLSEDTTNHNLNVTMSQQRFDYLTSSSPDLVARIMFVRHPVLRIVSGYREIFCVGHTICHSRHFRGFPNFVYSPNRTVGLQNTYRSDCHHHDHADIHLRASVDGVVQHWAPPQHCRCGIPDCHIQYQYYHLERIPSTQHVLNGYLQQLQSVSQYNNNGLGREDAPWLAPTHVRANLKTNTEQTIRFLLGSVTDDEDDNTMSNFNVTTNNNTTYTHISSSSYNTTLLDYLNALTKPEQEYFGYLPLTVENVLQGTVDILLL